MSIGVCINTYNREDAFIKCYDSLPHDSIDELIIVKDGGIKYNCLDTKVSRRNKDYTVLDFVSNNGVATSKNAGLAYLNHKKCDHIFLIEDDIIVKDPKVFDVYISTAKKTGVYHLNFSKIASNKIIHSTDDLDLHEKCQGAFMYMYKGVVKNIGGFDQGFINAFEHIEWYYRCSQKGLVPPFWWFADAKNSDKYLCENLDVETTISGKGNYKENLQKSANHFFAKYNKNVKDIPKHNLGYVINDLNRIEKHYSRT